MNFLLWSLQGLLALWNLIGGSYTFSHYENLKSVWAGPLPQPAWAVLCLLQVLAAIGLLWPKLTPFAAIYLALNALAGLALFAQYAGFPGMLWGLIPAALLAFVGYGRFMLKPF